MFICVLLASGGYVLTGQVTEMLQNSLAFFTPLLSRNSLTQVLKNDMALDTASNQTPSCKTQTGLISPGYKEKS